MDRYFRTVERFGYRREDSLVGGGDGHVVNLPRLPCHLVRA
jgi:hypothetical protein